MPIAYGIPAETNCADRLPGTEPINELIRKLNDVLQASCNEAVETQTRLTGGSEKYPNEPEIRSMTDALKECLNKAVFLEERTRAIRDCIGM